MIRALLLPAAVILLATAATATAATAENPLQQAAFGAKVFAENCSRCHEAPDPCSRDGRTWRSITLHMRLFADISRTDQQRVLAFLRTFNTPRKP